MIQYHVTKNLFSILSLLLSAMMCIFCNVSLMSNQFHISYKPISYKVRKIKHIYCTTNSDINHSASKI